MAGIDLNFEKIRAVGGSRNHGFEELCAQLASLEPCESGATFFRKGPGADAGVECYLRSKSGAETGWQAKYFLALGASQISQLDESIAQALDKHPKLNRYLVCLPINLKDSRTGRSQTELQRWQKWVSKWEKGAEGKKRGLTIGLWGKTELLERFGRDDPLYSGRAAYWFDETILTTAWFDERFARARAGLGERYTPETNVELPIRSVIQAFCRDPSIYGEFARRSEKLDEARYRVPRDAKTLLTGRDSSKLINELDATLGHLATLVSIETRDPTFQFPLTNASDAARQALSAISAIWRSRWEQKADDGKKGERLRTFDYSLRKLDDLLDEIVRALASDRCQVVNRRRLLVSGDAGVGKSHLFGDATEYQLNKGRPAILILGASLIDDDPWAQITRQLGLSLDVDTFLGALDAAGEASASRAVIFIDAINERHGIDLWAERLPSFLAAIERYPRVGIALSCRTTYMPFVFPDGVGAELVEIEHEGFAGRASEAARFYLDKRGIVRMAAPGLVPEFENPLFLKTCCDYLLREGKREIPRGLRGVTEIFRFYTEAITKQINKLLRLDPKLDIVPRSIEALASAFDGAEHGYLPYDEANAVAAGILPSDGRFDRSLLAQLISEGILADEPVLDEDGKPTLIVRFTFQRFSDHRIAHRLLDTHVGSDDILAALAKGGVLHEYVTGARAYHHAGVTEALAIQLPERYGVELADALAGGTQHRYLFGRGLVDSILWRDPTSFTQRTLELLDAVSAQTGRREDLHALIAVATEPRNKFNADFLHGKLFKLSMPDRDSAWSMFIVEAYESEESAIETLIVWTMQNGFEAVEDERARLAAVALSWLLSASHRELRDRATKALATLLAPRLTLAADLITKFKNVSDLYVLDRVLAASYGGALQGVTQEGLGAAARAAFNCVFRSKTPLVHVLIRDHARGLVELAAQRGVLPTTIKIAKARPPYRSDDTPIEDVPKATIEGYVQDYPSGHRLTDGIVSSAVKDGDFARYIVDSVVDDFSALPLRLANKSAEDIFEEWFEKLLERNEAAAALVVKLMEACIALREEKAKRKYEPLQIVIVEAETTPREEDRRSDAEKEVDQLEARVCSALGDGGDAEYAIMARAYIREGLSRFGRSHHSWPPRFNTKLGRRWICKRAHDLGWTPERFADFDRHAGRGDRHNHRHERIGKKYQWLAFHELIARLSDRQAFIGSFPRDGTSVFQGAWQLRCRDIDPSLFRTQTPADVWGPSETTWWTPVGVELGPVSPQERLTWLKRTDNFINGAHLIEVADPKTKRTWLVIDEFASWDQKRKREGDQQLERDMWTDVACLIVRTGDRSKLVKALGANEVGNRDLPELERASSGYVGEYPWHPVYVDLDPWVEPDTWNGMTVKTQPVMTEYLAERGGHDYSIEETFSVKLPAPGLIDGMSLHLSNGQAITYSDASGQVLFFDPSTRERGRNAALVDRNAFLAFLERERLEAVWVIKGEKRAMGGPMHGHGFGGAHTFVSIYWLTSKGFQHLDKTTFKPASAAQLKEFFETGEDQRAVKVGASKPRKARSKNASR